MNKKKLFKIYEKILSFLKKNLEIILNTFKKFDKKYPYTSQKIQLTFVYFFAFIDLVYSILNNVFALGFFSETMAPFHDFLEGILQSPFLKIWGSPEKVFLMSYLVLEFMVIRSSLNFSKFVKYNILLVFALLMLQGLTVSLWDVLFHREIADEVANWTFDEGMLIATNKEIAVFFFFITFIAFIIIYYFFYTNALRGKIVTVNGFHWITDSVAFWLRIKTPSMKFRGEEKKDLEE
jgi:hypothetical protein